MQSFIEANDEVLDYAAIQPKLKEQPKCFSFFIYYIRDNLSQSSSHLQKLAFTIREDRSNGFEKQDYGKLIHIYFVDLQAEAELEQSFFELKMQILQSPKIKLIFYAQEYHFVNVIVKAKAFGVDLSLISSAVYSPDLHQDLAQHLGWKEPHLGDLSLKSSVDFQSNVKKWIASPGERIDMWTAQITVDSQQGAIYRLDHGSNKFGLVHEKQLSQHFISHVCIGHHAELAANYESNRKEHGSKVNHCIFGVESVKKFCCLGSPSFQDSTGVVSIFYKDQKGYQQEISKELVKNGQKRGGAVSLLLANIDKYMGMKLSGGRLNDRKLEMGVCESSKDFRLMDSAGGDIVVKMNTPEVYMSVGSVCYKLQHAREIRVSHWGKVKLLISKDTLEC